jgi:hypothetical protein
LIFNRQNILIVLAFFYAIIMVNIGKGDYSEEMSDKVQVFGKEGCPYTDKARVGLAGRKVSYDYYDVKYFSNNTWS